MKQIRKTGVNSSPSASLITIVCMVMLLVFNSAQAQLFDESDNPEDTYPNNMPQYSSNTSAYAVPSYKVGGNFIYVHTWDNGSVQSGGAGFAVQEYIGDASSGTLVNRQEMSLGDVGSVEAFIAEDNTHEYHIILTYYNFTGSSFDIVAYHWDASTGLNQIAPPQPIAGMGIGNNVPFGWIRNDAIEYYDFAITWSTNNQLFVVGGNFFASGLTLSNPLEIVQDPVSPTVFIGGFDRPDIALNRSQYGGAFAHIVFTDNTHTELGVIRIPLNNILSAASTPTPLPYAAITSLLVDYQTTSGEYYHPRIDAIDYLSSYDEAWSYVVQENVFESPDWHDRIITGVYDNFITYGVNHYGLNTGAIPLNSLDPISATINPITYQPRVNTKPVVAFGRGDQTDVVYSIYYGWFLEYGDILPHANPLNSFNTSNTYIGLKLNAGGNLAWTNNAYFVVPLDPDYTSPEPSVAFSCNNHPYHTGLYSVFTQEDITVGPPSDINLAYKISPYTDINFRPQPEEETKQHEDFLVYPNPFDKGFRIKAAQDKGETYNLKITDILGRVIVESKGTIKELNTQLSTEPKSWHNGQYILQLKNEATGEVQIKKLAAMR